VALFLLLFRNAMVRRVVQAPEMLGRETHDSFRRQALEVLEALRPEDGEEPLVIDLSATRIVDSAGLSALVLVQRRAAEIRRPVHLREVSEELRFLLVMTRLDDRFVFEGPVLM
jgi:anti-anti-sigma regulatory factor